MPIGSLIVDTFSINSGGEETHDKEVKDGRYAQLDPIDDAAAAAAAAGGGNPPKALSPAAATFGG